MKSSLNILLLNYRNYLKNLFPQSFIYILNKELFLKSSFKNLKNVLFFLKNHSQSQFKVLSDICAIDYPWKQKRFILIYNLLSITFNSRITVITSISDEKSIDSISTIFKVAGWFEREIWDMFGIYFLNHGDLRRILTDYGFKGHPLRKDFPLTGYTQIRYSHIKKRILNEELSLEQDLRTFYFNNTWE